jgi:hypothetical protein
MYLSRETEELANVRRAKRAMAAVVDGSARARDCRTTGRKEDGWSGCGRGADRKARNTRGRSIGGRLVDSLFGRYRSKSTGNVPAEVVAREQKRVDSTKGRGKNWRKSSFSYPFFPLTVNLSLSPFQFFSFGPTLPGNSSLEYLAEADGLLFFCPPWRRSRRLRLFLLQMISSTSSSRKLSARRPHRSTMA